MSTDTGERLVKIEMAVAHIDHDLGELHQALLNLQKEMRTLSARLDRLQRTVEESQESPETRDPGAEKPPHY